MAVSLTPPTELLPVAGALTAATSANIYKTPRDDLALLAFDSEATLSVAFTRNQFCAAPVTVAREHLRQGPARHLLVNAGNANAGTGAKGIADAKSVCEALARQLRCKPEAVLPFSTGVIGEPLPVEQIRAALPALCEGLTEGAWLDCAKAIMTTDTAPKGTSRSFETDAGPMVVTGIAKGSGMIHPDMATMLAFIATDAALEQPALDRLLQACVAQSFNRICVDGDTSTNDACALVATGRRPVAGESRRLLEEAVEEVCQELAQAIVRDGEGATKFVTIQIEQARNEAECTGLAAALSTSPLVKTALYASDPNWGRILAVIGRSGIDRLEIDKVSVWLNEVCVVEKGARAENYTEEAGATALRGSEITLRVALNRGQAEGRYWTCDLSPDYVAINANYRT